MRIDEVPIGTRVSVRSRADDGWLNDAVGEVSALTDGVLTVETRKGPKQVEIARVTAWKVVPPPPVRPHR